MKVANLTILVYVILEGIKKRKRKRSKWVRNWLLEKNKHGMYRNLLSILERENPQDYRRFLRMNPSVFHELLALVEPYITRKDTCMRKAIPAGERLAITLRYIASGK